MSTLVLIALLGLLLTFLPALWDGRARAVLARRAAMLLLGTYLSASAAQNVAVLAASADLCQPDCPDDDDGQHCLANCHSCMCGTLLARVPLMPHARFVASEPVLLEPSFEPPQTIPSPPFHKIFRPPIA